ncbi:MAG: hypothetical protein AAGA48_12905 [Myxococcota bacterium]
MTMMLLTTLFATTADAATPRASSYATDSEGQAHPASHAFDGLLSTAWAEGAKGDGAGEWIEIRFDERIDVASVSIWPGWLGGLDREIREFGRPRAITVSFDTTSGTIEEKDVILDPAEAGPLRHDIPVSAPGARSMRITIDDPYGGGIRSDTYVAEIAVNLTQGKVPSSVKSARKWLTSATTAKAKHRDRAIALFDKISAEQFGDTDSLKMLLDWAADGAPYVRSRVRTRVPAGFRVLALPPDEAAIEALLKLRDANAVPAIERAALRVTGSASEVLERRAKLFEAYGDLIGGGARLVEPWGQSGFAEGALRSFGEPLNMALDPRIGVVIADVGNHRVQRFQFTDGRVDASFGAEKPGLSESWFSRRRDPYAAGAAPGGDPGQFVHPMDVATRPTKSGAEILVLDQGRLAEGEGNWGRITHLDSEGNVLHTEPLGFTRTIEGGVSGAGHLVATNGWVAALWADQGVVYKTGKDEWTETARFEMKDGTPQGAIQWGGRLGLIYGTSVILYGRDGFRFGKVEGLDFLRGAQDWGVTLDNKGKLWAVLDKGDVLQFTKSGKVKQRAVIDEYGLVMPRLVVSDELAFISSEDRIIQADIREIIAQGEAPEEGELLQVEPR